MKIFRIIRAKKHKVPFREIMWYNYIDCPNVGGFVTVYHYGKLYLYKVVGFRNKSRNGDWLFDGDWINPIVEFVKPL